MPPPYAPIAWQSATTNTPLQRKLSQTVSTHIIFIYSILERFQRARMYTRCRRNEPKANEILTVLIDGRTAVRRSSDRIGPGQTRVARHPAHKGRPGRTGVVRRSENNGGPSGTDVVKRPASRGGPVNRGDPVGRRGPGRTEAGL